MTELPESITRVVVINEDGSQQGEWFAQEWEFSVQDEGKTLKAWRKDWGRAARAARSQALAKNLEDYSKGLMTNLPDNPYRVDLLALGIVCRDRVTNDGLEVSFIHGPTGMVGSGRSTSEAWMAFKEAVGK